MKKFNQIICIADLHLSAQDTALTNQFLNFLSRIPPKVEALLILGDFFDYWLGDSAMSEFHQNIAEAISKLSIPVFFLPGNRDFLPAKKWLKLANIQPLKAIDHVLVGRKKVTLMHGDELCTNDIGYLIYRNLVRNQIVQTCFNLLPLFLKKTIANQLRKHPSQSQIKKTKYRKYAPDTETLKQMRKHHQSDILVHGHIHKKGIYPHKNFTRVVLNDWSKDAFSYCLISENKINLI